MTRPFSDPAGVSLRVFVGLLLLAMSGYLPRANAECFAANKATFVAQTVPGHLAPGERRCGVQIRMSNVGNTSNGGAVCPTLWKPEFGYRLGSQNVENNTLWGISRVTVDTSATAEGAQEEVFNFCITAPTTVGLYNFQWRMLQEGTARNCFACGGCETIPGAAPEWFGEYTPNVAIQVTSDPNAAKVKYVALGDSYAAGIGLAPYASDSPGAGQNKCQRSSHAYANQVIWPDGASDSQMTRNFYACSGAVTHNLASVGQFGDAAQFSHTDEIKHADLVTLSIGGNNMGFGDLVGQCSTFQLQNAGKDLINAVGGFLNGQWNPPSWNSFDPRSCVYKGIYDQTYQRIKRLNACGPGDTNPECANFPDYSIAGTLTRLRMLMKSGAAGPSTGIVVGYPHVAPSGDGPAGYARQHCPAMVVADLDPCEQTFIRDGVDQLDKILQREALNQGFHFLDLRETFEADGGHDVCEEGDDWIHSLFIPHSIDELWSLFHPTIEGHAGIARAIEKLLRTGAQTNARTPAGMPRFRKRHGGDFGGWVESIYHQLPGVPGNLNWCENSSNTSAALPASVSGKSIATAAPTRQGIHDGNSDIFWRNISTGDNGIWYMEGTTPVGSATLPNVGDTGNWYVAGMGDFNHDGQEDIFWRNTATGVNVVWYMRGTTPIGSASLPTVDSGWRVGAVADFNGDSSPDIVWRHASGANVIWQMNGVSLVTSVSLPAIADPNWQIQGAGDFNNDGSTDLLWRNPVTTAMSVWLMDGTATKSGIEFPAGILPDSSWALGAIMDVDNDDNLDLIWRNNLTGEVAAMYLKQTEYKGFSVLFTLADGNWQIAGPR